MTTIERSETMQATKGGSARWALAGLSLSMLLSALGTSTANVALPALVEDFGASFQAAQWVVLVYLLVITSLVVGAGRLGDLVGRRRLLIAGLLAYGAASLACGLATDLWQLVAARAVQGVGAAAMMALTLAFVGETVPKERTGRAMGLLGAMSAVGTALGPSFGGLMIAAFGWRGIFFATAPLALAALLLTMSHLPADRAGKPARASFDMAGMALLALVLAAYALAMTLGRGAFGPLNLALLLVSAVGLVLFGLVEAHAPSPMIRIAMLRDRSLVVGFVTSALVATVMMTTLIVGPFYLAQGLGLNAARVGLVVSIGPAVVAVAGVPAGRLADRFGAPRMALAGLTAIAAGCFALAALPASFAVIGYAVPLVVTTAGYALFQTANNTVVMRDVAPERRGTVSGLLNLSRNLGLVTGASAMGAVFAAASGGDMTAASAESMAAGMHVAFAVAGGLSVAAIVAAMFNRSSAQERA